jgi:hypothetical protein
MEDQLSPLIDDEQDWMGVSGSPPQQSASTPTTEKRHTSLTRDMQSNMNRYLMVQHLDPSVTNSSFLTFLKEECQLPEAIKVKVVYSKRITVRTCCVHFSCPLFEEIPLSDEYSDKFLILENVVATICEHSTSKQLICRPLRETDIEYFMRKKRKNKSRARSGIKTFSSIVSKIKERCHTNLDNSLEFIYLIDFELAVVTRDEYIPLEMSVVKYSLQKHEIVDKFHQLINPGDIPEYLMKTEQYTRRYIHGIPLDIGSTDYRGIWNAFLQFTSVSSIEDAKNCVLVAKDPNAENGCFRWFMQHTSQQYYEYIKNINNYYYEDYDAEYNDDYYSNDHYSNDYYDQENQQQPIQVGLEVNEDERIDLKVTEVNEQEENNEHQDFKFYFDHVDDFDVIIDLTHFLLPYQPGLTEELAIVANKRVIDHLDAKDKCHFHQDAPALFHCALEDCCAIAHVLTKCLDSNWEYLNEPILEESSRSIHRVSNRNNSEEMGERASSPILSAEDYFEEWDLADDGEQFFEHDF